MHITMHTEMAKPGKTKLSIPHSEVGARTMQHTQNFNSMWKDRQIDRLIDSDNLVRRATRELLLFGYWCLNKNSMEDS